MPPSVIVVDDDEDTVRLFSEFLGERGINVIGKGYDGKEAIALFKEKKPDVVLIDIMMPNGSGTYAIKKIKEIKPNAKIIAVTADMTLSTEEKLKELNTPVIYKPFDMDKVIATINS